MSFIDALTVAFKSYARFSGRSSRTEFWCFVMFLAMFGAALTIVQNMVMASAGSSQAVLGVATVFAFIFGITYVSVLVPTLAVATRRLHDAGFSGWLGFLALFPGLGILVLTILWTRPTAAAR